MSSNPFDGTHLLVNFLSVKIFAPNLQLCSYLLCAFAESWVRISGVRRCLPVVVEFPSSLREGDTWRTLVVQR